MRQPLQQHTSWHHQIDWLQQNLNPRQWDWISSPKSLTQRMRQLKEHKVDFAVLHNGWGQPYPDELAALELIPQNLCWVRDITWSCGNTVWVCGRTVIPADALEGDGACLEHTGENSLGEILFSEKNIEREPFQYAKLDHADPWYQDILHEYALASTTQLVARRSVFYFANKPLLVSEAFLPTLFAIQPE